MLLGTHVSAAKSLANAPRNAAAIGCEVFQFFSRPPQGGPAKPITKELAQEFKEECKRAKIKECYLHAPYFINFASANNRIRYGSSAVLREELERGTLLGVRYLMTHLGSAREVGEKIGTEMVIKGVQKILEGYEGSCQLLLEISAGAGEIIGDTFEELGEILRGVNEKRSDTNCVAICFDTQHAFASGYNVRTKEGLDKIQKEFDKNIGLKYLRMSHCNDSKVALGQKKDAHEHIGDGFIGKEGFREILNHPMFNNVNLILETEPEGQEKDLKILKEMRE